MNSVVPLLVVLAISCLDVDISGARRKEFNAARFPVKDHQTVVRRMLPKLCTANQPYI